MRTIAIWFMRFCLAALIAVELLALSGLVSLRGEFNWYGGLILTASSVWMANELNRQFLRRQTGDEMPVFVPLFLLIAVYLDALGDILHWYAHYGRYDQLVHTMGGMAATLMLYYFFLALSERKGYRLDQWMISLMAITTTAFGGVLYEIEEYLEDLYRGSFIRLGNGPDTATDLLCNLVGSLLAIALVLIYTHIQARE